MVSKVAEGILKIDEQYVHFLEDYQLATVHSVRIKYNYPSFGSLYASYQFYESVDGSSIDYDGVYVHAEYRGKNNTYHAYTQYK